MSTIFTIGYEGASQDDVIDALREAEVTLLVDVRDRSASRKPGFSKTALSSGSEEAGIRYEHWRELGTPGEIRRLWREEGDWEAFSKAYRERLRLKQDVVESLAARVRGERACLLCFESDASRCHRSLLAQRLEDLGQVAESVDLQALRADSGSRPMRGRERT